MKRYSPNQHVPMKFHNLYVYLLNPIGILIRAAVAAVILLTVLKVPFVPEAFHPYDDILRMEQGATVLWVIFGFAALAFLFALWAEVLLARRRPLGVWILLLDYLLNLANAIWSAWKQPATENLIIAGVTLLISILVCVYYWKRSRLFH